MLSMNTSAHLNGLDKKEEILNFFFYSCLFVFSSFGEKRGRGVQ